MDQKELGPILAKVYLALRQQLEMTLELTMSLQATRDALQERIPAFESLYAEKLLAVQNGELGQQKTQALAQYDQVIGVIKSGHL